eukprot:CAMPEP_0171311938 /NCGR_PEP_ID=MMETSP0816-20121228/22231_1 /TAXON_ID=420281 /ORGANISM="Proboscia inermis, Strain CCAP1064/1" /LENGTH=195 /DNA_ID=CAMNT_0011797035 /DNA_START=765 /DNA_END=1352 /DNA_ORIENTATION=+
MKDGEFEELTAEYCAQMGEIVIGGTMNWPLYRPLLPIIGKLAKQNSRGSKAWNKDDIRVIHNELLGNLTTGWCFGHGWMFQRKAFYQTLRNIISFRAITSDKTQKLNRSINEKQEADITGESASRSNNGILVPGDAYLVQFDPMGLHERTFQLRIIDLATLEVIEEMEVPWKVVAGLKDPCSLPESYLKSAVKAD